MAFEPMAEEGDLWDGEMISCTVRDRKVLLLRVGEEVHAYEDRCAHLGVALSEGQLTGRVLTCRAHQYQYDACTGRGINPGTVCLTRFAVKTEGGSIRVEVPERVGPVLEASEAGRAVVKAIREIHPEAVVQDRGSYLRVLVPGSCRVTRQGVERALGRPFRLPGDLELLMPSFKGLFSVTEEEALWSFEETKAP